MPNKQNIDTVGQLTNELKTAKSIIIADYSGISVNDQTSLRQKVKASGATLGVIKNRLIKLALKERLQEVPASLDEALNGPTALVISQDDPVAPTKTLVEFARDHQTLKLKAGMLLKGSDEAASDQVLSMADLKNLATLPGKTELYGMLLARLNSPIFGLVNVLHGNIRGLVVALNAIKDKKNTN